MKCYKATVYVLDFEGYPPGDILYHLENIKHLNSQIEDFQVAEIGEWEDDHPLNFAGCDYSKYEFEEV